MNKIYKSTISLLIICCIFSIAFSFKNNNSEVFAETNVNQSQILTVDQIGTYYLYPNNNGVNSICDYFEYIADKNMWQQRENELYHYHKSNTQFASTTAKFISTINLASNLQNASKNGYLTVSASAYFASEYGGKIWFVDDSEDELRMSFSSFDENNQVLSSQSVDYTSYDYKDNPDILEISPQNATYLQLKFEELKKKEVYEIMRVKEPTLTFKTTDTTSPEAIFEFDTQNYTQKRIVTISVQDTQSGINSVIFDNAKLLNYDISEDTKIATYTYEISQNGNYKFVAVDNVGNEYTTNYVEEKIDTQKPEIVFVSSLNDIYYTKDITFEATFNKNTTDCATEYFVYTIDGTIPTQNSFQLLNGTNTITVQENGLYTLKITSFDDALNKNEIQEFTFYVDDNFYTVNTSCSVGGEVFGSNQNLRYGQEQTITFKAQEGYEFYYVKVNGQKFDVDGDSLHLTIRENYDVYVQFRKIVNVSLLTNVYPYTGDVVELNITANIEDLSELKLVYYQNDVNVDFVNIGEYKILYSIDTENYIGSGELYASISQKQIAVVELNKTEYVFDESGFVLDFSSNVDASLINFAYYTNQDLINEITPFLVGEYVVKYSVNSTEYVGSGVLNFNIVKKQLDITVNDFEFTYDGAEKNIVATNLLNKNMLIQYFQNGIVVKPINAGIYDYIVTIKDENYCGETNGQFEIKRACVSVDFNGNSFIYDKQEKIPVITVENKLPYTLTIYNNNKQVKATDVGTYDIVVIVDEENYFTKAQYSYTILPREITVTASSKTITYGEDVEDISYTITNDIKEDNLHFDVYIKNLNVDAGQYEICITPKEYKNYSINYVDGKLIIEQKILHVYISNDNQKTYGEEDQPIKFTYTEEDVVNNDDLEFSIQREQGENVGTYAINDVSVNNKNYKIELVTFSYKINKRKIALKINSISKVYEDDDPTFTYDVIYGNIVNDDQLVYEFVRENGENVGSYLIDIKSSNFNYDIIYMQGVLEITKRNVKVVADNITAIYGEEDKELTYSSNILESDNFTGSLAREIGKNAGVYNITIGTLKNPNYEIEFVGGLYTIEKAQIDVFADKKEKQYSDEDCELTYTLEGLKYNDELTIKLTRQQGENVGVYKILLGENDFENYYINFHENDFTITKKQITLEFLPNQNKEYGHKDPEIQFDVSCDEIPSDLKVYREEGENVGTYKLLVQNCELQNYIITNYNKCFFEITKANVNLKLNDKNVVYDGQVHLINPIDNLDLKYVYSQNGIEVLNPINAGEYSVVAYFKGNENYNSAISNEAILTIEKQSVFITVEEDTFVYDGSSKLPKFSLSKDCLAVVNMNVLNAIDIGNYDFEIVVNEQNYKGSIKGVLKIIKAPTFVNQNGNEVFDKYGDLVLNDVTVELCEDTSSKTLSKISNMLTSKKVLVSYSFNVSGNVKNNTKVVVRLNANSSENLNVYLYNDKNEVKEVGYQIIDDMIVFEISDLSLKFALAQNQTNPSWLLYVIIGVGVILVFIVAWVAIKMYIFAVNTIKKTKEESGKHHHKKDIKDKNKDNLNTNESVAKDLNEK